MRHLILASIVLVASACDRRPHPWDQPDAAGSAATPFSPPVTTAGLVEGEGDASPGSASPAQAPEAPTPPVRVGGPWVRCYGGFHPEGDPVKDVTRLSILCGPENGMKRLSKQPFEGAVAAGGPAVPFGFTARRGECYRVFAVAEPTVEDLDVVVRSSRGAPLAADHGEDAWPIVQPDRPFCPLEDDRYTVEVSAKRGAGRFAAEVWVLRTPGSPPASAPPQLAPPASAPPQLAPPASAPPQLAPPASAPPQLAPPASAPPQLAPSASAPP